MEILFSIHVKFVQKQRKLVRKLCLNILNVHCMEEINFKHASALI